MRKLFVQNKEDLKDILRFGVLRTAAIESLVRFVEWGSVYEWPIDDLSLI